MRVEGTLLQTDACERYDQHKKLIAVIMNRFFLRYLNLLYREFEGDLVLPIVLGEIAHHNIIRLYSLKDGCIEINTASSGLSRADEALRAHERLFHQSGNGLSPEKP
jgi:hypothetical protein